ncbi:MAG: hypothetical protein KIT36_21525 [Alphaproteobacteria bacterium]|nr:hypothetical protein [Alphaproteobacteria bacterium]
MTHRPAGLARLCGVAAVAAVAGALSVYLPMSQAEAENQPHMRNALQSLQTARAQLQQATADKGGHRAAALTHVNAAIDQVQKGIAFDNRR